MKKVFLCLLSGFCIFILGIYLNIVLIFPAIINNKSFPKIVENFAMNKFNAKIIADDINLKISPLLKVTLKIKVLKVINKNKTDIIDLSDFNLKGDIKTFSCADIYADNIRINLDELSAFVPLKEKKRKKSQISIDYHKLPNLMINKIIIEKSTNPQLFAQFDELIFDKNKAESIINLKGIVKLDRLSEPVILGSTGSLYAKDNKIFADNYSFNINNVATFFVNGNILNDGKSGDFNIISNDINIKNTMPLLLFLQKFTEPTKKFIENFKNYNGNGYLKIDYNSEILTGYAKLTNVSADTVLFGIPLRVNEAEFFLKNNEITSFVTGFAGKEKITHKLHMVDILSKDRIAYGEVRTTLTKRLADSYLPHKFALSNKIDLGIDYEIQHRKVKVKYNAYFPVLTDIVIDNYSTGTTDKEKIITAETYKDGTKLYLKSYRYALNNNGSYQDIVTGDGYFINDNGKMFPQFVTCKTNGFVPNSFAGSFGSYVVGGKFNGSIKYVIPKKQLIGNFEVVDTIFNDFRVKSAKVVGDEEKLNVIASGKFRKQNFSVKGTAKNDFRGKIYVENMDLFLEKFILGNAPQSTAKKEIDIDASAKKISSKVRKIHMDIDKWKIFINKLNIADIPLNDVLLQGSLKNSIFKYGIPKLLFADGEITARGTYDFNADSSIIDFSSKNINSNIIATKFFNLPNQIEGIATATLHSQAGKNLSDWNAYATFEIDNGSLPQIEQFQFSPNKSNPDRKVKISDFIKFNANKKGNIKSKLSGSFRCNDISIYDVDVRLQHEFISSFVTGFYNTDTDDEKILVYGKYDNTVAKKIKVFYIPLNWIINLITRTEKNDTNYGKEFAKVPKIGIDDSEAKFFKIDVDAKPNQNKFNVKLRILKNNL